MLFDAVKDGQKISPKWVPPEHDQGLNESRRQVVLPAISIRSGLTLTLGNGHI